MQEMSARDVFTALEVMAGLKLDMPQLPLILPMREKIKTAIRRDDPDAVAQYATMSIAEELTKAGYTGVITPRGLREHVDKEGWNLIMDAVARRENAAAVLKSKIDTIQGGSQFAPQQQNQHRGEAHPAPPAPRSERPDPTAQRREPERAQAAQPVRQHQRQEGQDSRPAHPQSARNAPEQDSQRGRYQAPQRPNSSVSRGPMLQPPAPQRTGGEGNVRSINSGSDRGQGQASAPAEDRQFDKVKVHGGKAALTIEADTTTRDEPTICIEAAKMLNRESRTYDWSNKIAFQLTVAELQHITALLHGFIDHLKFQNHGPQQDKWLEIERQTGDYAGTIKVVVGKGSDLCLVQITSADIGNVSSLFRRRCAQQMRETLASLKDALEVVAVAYNQAQAARAQKGQGSRGSGGSQQPGAGYRRQAG